MRSNLRGRKHLEEKERGFIVKEKKTVSTQMLVIVAMMVALHIVLSRFVSINAWNMKIGLAFLPVFITAYLYGPWAAMIVGGLGDFLGAILFPIGPYFPGFTLNCALTGLVMGLFLYKKQTPALIAAAVALDQLGISLWLTPVWISILYGSPYWPLIVSRFLQIGLMLVIEFAVILLMSKVMDRAHIKKKYAN